MHSLHHTCRSSWSHIIWGKYFSSFPVVIFKPISTELLCLWMEPKMTGQYFWSHDASCKQLTKPDAHSPYFHCTCSSQPLPHEHRRVFKWIAVNKRLKALWDIELAGSGWALCPSSARQWITGQGQQREHNRHPSQRLIGIPHKELP